MALYEVMSKARARSEQIRTVEPVQPIKKPEPVKIVKPVPVKEEIEIPEPKEKKVNWRKKPRIVQYNLGRIEFSVPYQLAITAGLGLVLLLLLAFRFGQFSSGNNSQPVIRSSEGSESSSSSGRTDLTDLSTTERTRIPVSAENNETRTPPPVPDERIYGDPEGTNVIVLAEYEKKTHLQPVLDYFMLNGIPTRIVQVGNNYQLWTVDKFMDNPANPGTKGNELIQKIKKIGANYQAPQGYEPFAPQKFSDAYGKKVVN